MLTIERLIIHKVDHHTASAPQLSDLVSPLSVEAAEFVAGHITAGREHKNTRQAHFLAGGDAGPLPALADRLLGSAPAFVSASQEVARHLFATVQSDRRISASDLFVCLFSESGVAGLQVALLKMEPLAAFAARFQRVDGRRTMILQPVEDVLPTGDLQKSAFILPADERARRGCDLRVLDQQIARFGARRPVASFFTDRFLGCRVSLTGADLTSRFVYDSARWLRTVEEAWPVGEAALFKERLRTALRDQQVDLTAFAAGTISDPGQQEAYLAYMVDQGPGQLTFTPDPGERRRWLNRVTYEGDNDLEVRIDPAAVGPGKTLQAAFDPATGLWTITIRSSRWQEKMVKGGAS